MQTPRMSSKEIIGEINFAEKNIFVVAALWSITSLRFENFVCTRTEIVGACVFYNFSCGAN